MGMEERSRSLGLQSRFLLGLAVILFGATLVSAGFIYSWGKQTIEEEALQRTELVIAAVDAVRDYVREELRPRMYEVLGRDAFVLEAMSASYVSRAVMDRFRRRLPEFEYRRVALAPLNPASAAKPVEERMIRYFQENRQARGWHGIVNQGSQPFFVRYEPVAYSADCLFCHGDGRQLPAGLNRYYPQGRSVTRTGVAGLISIGIPLNTGLAQIQDRAFSVFAFAFLFLVLLYGVISFFFDRVVIQSLRQLLALFRQNLRDEEGLKLYERARSRDAIEGITAAAEAMAAHIRQAEQRLADHAQELERMVAERTRALRQSERQLQEKVRARNRELHALTSIAELITRSVQREAILPLLLRKALELVPAGGAALYLVKAGEQGLKLELQCAENAPQLARELEVALCGEAGGNDNHEVVSVADSLAEAACGQMSFLPGEQEGIDSLSVPLCCRNLVHGVMVFVEVDVAEVNADLTGLLSSIGQQIGILIESSNHMQQLLQNATLLQSVFDGITDLVALLDRDCRFRMVNRAFLERQELTLPEVLGMACDRLSSPRPSPFAGCRAIQGFVPGRSVSRLEYLDSGEIFEVNFYPLFREEELESIVCYGKEVTRQRQAEERIQHAERMVAIGQLAAGVAHEINNPLGVILCYTDLLTGELADRGEGGLAGDLAVIERHAQSCRRIVADLLQFARGGAMVREASDLNAIVEEAAQMVQGQMAKQEIELECRLAGSLPQLVVDRNKIKQVLLNLLINAAQAIGGKGRILLVSRPAAGGGVELVVEDSGPGIPAEVLPRIFDPFFSTKPVGEGTGLGLAVSYGIIKEHGGEIVAESRPGRGARLVVALPPVEEEVDEGAYPAGR